jgi:peptidoglycan/xylan/chitin deacetylase (PgdA/CDA1 family)
MYKILISLSLLLLPFGKLASQQQKRIPILCYHNIRESMKGHDAAYTITTDQFASHLQMLADSGFHSILPDEFYKYLADGGNLPEKPIMITFDDTHEEHFLIAAPLLEKAGFNGVFFVMTVTIGKSGYMTASEIKQLCNNGHAIEQHTWDHPDLRKLSSTGWDIEIDDARKTLETITGKRADFFAYPFGAWNEDAIEQLKARGVKAAFQLTGKESVHSPLYTIPRLLVVGNWSATTLYNEIQATFK